MPRVHNCLKDRPTPKIMNQEIIKYKTYLLTARGRLTEIILNNTDDYNHQYMQLHHYILFKNYEKNKKWYDERGIEQKLILMPTFVHEQVHQQAVNNLSDEDFLYKFGISRWDLLFNRKHTRY